MKSAEELIESIKKSFNAPSSKDEKIKVVVFCVIISTTFWFFSALNKSDYVTQINYPIELQYDEEQFVAVSALPRQVRLEVQGGGWDLMTRSFGFAMEPIQIQLEDPATSHFRLTSALRGELTPKLEPVVVNFILQDSIVYDIERKVQRSIPLFFDSSAVQLARDFRITSPVSLSQNRITFTGPESMVNDLPDPYPIDPDNELFDASVDQSFDISLPASELISADVEEVDVSFEVEEFVLYETSVPIMKLNFNDSTLGILPNRANLSYRVRKSKEVDSDSMDIMVLADFLSLNASDSLIDITIAVQAPHITELELRTTQVKVIAND